MKDIVKAEEVCDDLIALVKEKAQGQKYAVKALYMKAKNMLNVMEFRKAKAIIEEQALPLVKGLIGQVDEEDDKAEEEQTNVKKVLKDHKYSFEYRKKHALYLKKFAFYDQALEALN